jgi:hypothetical protein
MLMFEFQREEKGGDWVALGLARNSGDRSDYASALRGLRATLDQPLTAGTYRLRPIEPGARWRFAEVDQLGDLKLIDRGED